MARHSARNSRPENSKSGLPITRRPADMAVLQAEIADARVGGARSIIAGHPADGLTPQRLAVLLRQAEDGDATAYLELAEQMEERDLHYLSVLGTRKRQVAQLPISIEAGTDDSQGQRIADFLRDWISRDTLETELFDIMDAVGKGFSVTEIVWNLDGQFFYPEKLKLRDPRWFEFDRVTGEQLLLRGGVGDDGGMQLVPLPPAKFIQHLHPAKSGLPIRSGFARAIAWAYLFKNYALKDWVSFCEIFGMPLRLGKYEPGATEEQIGTLMRAVASISQDAAAVIPKSMELDFVDGKSTGSADLYERLCDYLDRQISKAVLGQTATTDADTGGLGSGKEHGDVRADIERADARLLAATLQRDLIMPMVRFNFGDVQAWPKIRIGREAEHDIPEMVSALTSLVPLGLRVEESIARDRLGFPDPPADAVLLTPAQAAFVNPAETAPPAAPDDAAGPELPASAAKAASGHLKPSYFDAGTAGDVLIVAAARVAVENAQIDQAVGAILDARGREMLAPIIEPLIEALEAGASFTEAQDILASVAADMDDSALAAMLEQACLISRMAGETGQDG